MNSESSNNIIYSHGSYHLLLINKNWRRAAPPGGVSHRADSESSAAGDAEDKGKTSETHTARPRETGEVEEWFL